MMAMLIAVYWLMKKVKSSMGDQIMLLCALKLKEEGKLKGDTIVGTVMSNIGFHKAAEELV